MWVVSKKKMTFRKKSSRRGDLLPMMRQKPIQVQVQINRIDASLPLRRKFRFPVIEL
jgi:hypothetical protein